MILTSVKGFKPPNQAARDVDIYTGLTAVVGDEGAGKTALLSAIAASHHDVCYVDHAWVHASRQELNDTPLASWPTTLWSTPTGKPTWRKSWPVL